METFGNNFSEKSCAIFYCKKCDYETLRKSSYNKHCESIKHKKVILDTSVNILDANICAKYLTC